MPEPAERSPTFCILPWLAAYNRPAGEVLPCCEYSGEPAGALGRAPWTQLQNSEPLKRLRRRMLEGRRDAGCSVCYAEESGGVQSLRRASNDRFARFAPLIDETRADGSLPRPRLRFLHITFSNICNLRCRMCGEFASTAWYADAAALREGDVLSAPLAPAQPLEALLRELDPVLEDVAQIHISGGEPLLDPRHYAFLEHLLRRGLTGIGLSYNTNLSSLRHQRWDVAELWGRFAEVAVGASFDAMGRRGEYLRKGLRWDAAVDNWRRLRRECPRVQLAVRPTVTIFNALHLPDFHREWIDGGLARDEEFRLSFLTAPRHYSLQALPPRLKDRVRARWREHIRERLSRLGPAARGQAHPMREIGMFLAGLEFMKAADLSGELPAFREATRELDALRGESFAQVFPELRELLDEEQAAIDAPRKSC